MKQLNDKQLNIFKENITALWTSNPLCDDMMQILAIGAVILLESDQFKKLLADLHIVARPGNYEQALIEETMSMLRNHKGGDYERDNKTLVVENALFALSSALTVVLRPK